MDDGKIIQQGSYEEIIKTAEYLACVDSIKDECERQQSKGAVEDEEVSDLAKKNSLGMSPGLGLKKKISIGGSRQRTNSGDSQKLARSNSGGSGDLKDILEDSMKKRTKTLETHEKLHLPTIEQQKLESDNESNIPDSPDLKKKKSAMLERDNAREDLALTPDLTRKDTMGEQKLLISKNSQEVKVKASNEIEIERRVSQAEKHEKLIDNIIASEDRAKGSVGFNVIKDYFDLSGGWFIIIIYITMMAFKASADGLSTWYLSYWGGKPTEEQNIATFLIIYSVIGVSSNIIMISRSLITYNRALWASRILNFKMCQRLLHASTTQFWDRVPLGRILNRFTRDQNIVDREMPGALNFFLFATFNMLLDLVMATISSNQLLWIAIIIYFGVCLMIQRYYMFSLRDITRLQAISLSPVTQVYSETLSGIMTIRIFQQEKAMIDDYHRLIDENFLNQHTLMGIRAWFGIRVEILSLLVVIPGFFLFLWFQSEPGMFAIMLTYTLKITDDIVMWMRTVSNSENRLISFERCSYFMKLETEDGYTDIADVEEKFFKNLPLTNNFTELDTQSICNKGEVEFRGYSCKYRAGLDFVLKDINIKIRSGKKVGIVGRTGAGKTTFLSAVYRAFDQFEGSICIDGMDITKMDLKKFRSKITIIPQDPHLFDDSLRRNLDPNCKYQDANMEKILVEFQIWEKFESKGGLDFKIEQNGQNLSQGEKQLLVMARALLNKNQLIL
jgi:ABC-type multidrug transport system fused ATPase/permease subunit